ncbi:zinc finger protein OZF [Anabrus simplex]|uniref:zinc finger protein OZF n=1 Tax=Anabrus simplex TaxID=316456 RepID=UPI0035A283D6
MDHKIEIKDELVWFEGTAGSSFENYELTTEETHLKEETKSELAEPGQTQPFAGVKDEICVDEHTVGQLVPRFKEEDTGPVDMSDSSCKKLKKENRSEVIYNLLPRNIRNLRLSSHSGEKSVHPSRQRALCCNECGKTFHNKSYLRRHLFADSEGRPYCSDGCGKSFSHKSTLSKHVRAVKGMHRHLCKDKDKRLRDKLKKSMLVLTRPYRCDLCGNTFSRKTHVKHHVLTHTGVRSEFCKQCGKGFRDKNGLSRHMRRHTGERPFLCEKCGKGFSAPRVLNKHVCIETRVRRYSCDQCGDSFSLKSHLERHLPAHTGERPYVCGDCGYPFSQKSYLRAHVFTHSGLRPFTCNECGGRFRYKKTLIRHLRLHTDVRPYSCNECGTTFPWKYRLTRHMLIHNEMR